MTNNPTGIQIPGLDVLPVSWQGPALVVLFLVPYITRAYHALASGGGLKGVVNAILFGTNTPKTDKAPTSGTQ